MQNWEGGNISFGLLIASSATAAFCLVARRLSASIVTAPMVFIALGATLSVSGFFPKEQSETLLHPVAEFTLVVLLFLDAAQVDLGALRQRHVWPVRMLALGLPLMIVMGTGAAILLFPGQPIIVLALVAAILAPTDAALGQAVVVDPQVPVRPRRALIVESGLNDGLALPAVLLFASLTAHTGAQSGIEWVVFGLKQVVLGPVAGVAVGLAGGHALLAAKSRGMTAETFEGIAALALAGSAFFAAGLIGGNGFIAAFAAGLSFGAVVKGQCKFVFEFTEGEGQILAWGSFLLLGAALVPEAIAHLSWPMLALILLSLVVIRPLAIWAALIGTDAAPMTRAFFGWFGPRGLATALFALLAVEHLDHELADFVLFTAINAVWISAVLHGVTSAPGARWYARKVDAMGPCAETQPIETSAKPLATRK